jgi:excisionase family DNA binding protein
MTGESSKIHDVGIEPVLTVADTAAAAVKWRERAEQVEITKHSRALGCPAHTAANIPPTGVGRKDLHSIFYSVDEVAERLNVCSKTIRNRIRDGRLPAHRLGKKLAISKDDLADFVASSRLQHR